VLLNMNISYTYTLT